MATPLVSIIVPTKNSASTLQPCLASLSKQTYEPVEIIVVDNFSTDQTPEIAKQYTKLFFSKGPERSAQRNFGVEQAKGVYVCIIDSDMELDADVIKQSVTRMVTENSTGVVIPEESFGVGFWAQCKQLERSFYVGVPYMEAARFFRRSDFLKIGGYNVGMVSGEDWDLSQRIEELGPLVRTESYIHHNEGRISLYKTIKKKFYYAQKFSSYKDTDRRTNKIRQQTSIPGRYWLFLSRPRKLLKNPVLGVGMLFMKTCEFFFGGLGYLIARFRLQA